MILQYLLYVALFLIAIWVVRGIEPDNKPTENLSLQEVRDKQKEWREKYQD